MNSVPLNIRETQQLSRQDRSQADRSYVTPTLSRAVETFIRLELSIKERSDSTIRWYRERLETMCAYLGPDRSPESVFDVDLLDWLAALKERETLFGGSSSRPEQAGKLSVSTLRGYVRAARRFWHWLQYRHFIESNPASDLPMPAKPRVAKRGISDADQQAMIESAREQLEPIPLNDYEYRLV